MVVRPDNHGTMKAFCGFSAYDPSDPRLAKLQKASRGGTPEQKAVIQELFLDGDWEASRILDGMQKSDDFYLQDVAQVRLDRWSSGRVALVGDAAYAPSPFTGMGTSLAFIGAYVLAGEISKQPDNIPAALENYDRVLRPYVESVQQLPPGVPWIAMPQTWAGVKVFETVVWSVGKIYGTWVGSLVTKFVGWALQEKDFALPVYKAFEK